MTQAAIEKLAINPLEEQALSDFGEAFWLNELHLLEAGRAFNDRGVAFFSSRDITDVDTLHIVTNAAYKDGPDDPEFVILQMPVGGTLNGMTIVRAVWAGYIASLKATMDSGKNLRAHIGQNPGTMDLVASEVSALGAELRPCDNVYGSDGNYLEQIEFNYDPITKVLSAKPVIGS